MSENKELQTQNQPSEVVTSTNNIVIGTRMDVSNMTLEERVAAFQRYSEAQASVAVDNSFLSKKLVATDLTVYQRDFIDQETGEIGLATYVSFVLDDGRAFKTASAHALPFATSVAKFIGYEPTTGHLPHPITFEIRPSKAEQGFKYNFVFTGLADKK